MSGDAQLFVLAAVLAAVVVVAAVLWNARRLVPPPLPYYAKEHLCSKGELVFYRALGRALPKGVGITMKTRLGDVLGCTAEGWRTGFGAKIAQKHVDFILFDPVTTAVMLVVELDDRTHLQPDRQERDAFLDRALAAAGVPVLHVPAAKEYDSGELREEIEQVLRHAPAGHRAEPE
ncbi:MAG: hypothetical protein JWO31_1355 [Phycisphaerales bacterium]|nr:hypothetical protein [Phycisphaerales bacterium]